MAGSWWQSYKQIVRKNCVDSGYKEMGLPYWQDSIFAVSMTYLVPFSLVAILPGIYVSWVQDAPILVYMNFAIIAVFIVNTFVPGIPVFIRKLVVCGVIYVAAVVLLAELASFGPGLLYLLGANIIVVLILDRFWAFVSVALNLLICILFALLIHYQVGESLLIHEYTLGTWIGVSSNLIFLSLISVLLIPRLYNGLQSTIEQKAELERELVTSNRELEEFASVASHDLKEPLRMVRSFMDLLEKRYGPTLDEKANKYIHFARDGAERMAVLVDDLLEYSRVGRLYTKMEPTDLNEILEDVQRYFAADIEKKNATILWSRLPVVHAVPVSLRLIFQNLISNSLKYHSPDRPPEIVVNSAEGVSEWYFRVSDNGIGIDEAYYDQIFLLFKRLHARDEYEGSGMGLAICKKIVEQHGGTMEVESVPGKGTTFQFTLSKEL